MADLLDLFSRAAGRSAKNIQNAMPEALRNYIGNSEWSIGRDKDVLAGHDQDLVDFVDKASGFGTDAGGIVGAIKASHGTPHKFDRFDFSKIGTGEGAQVYGHGGYFAQGFDSPVAMRYQPRDPKMEEILMKEYSKAEKKFDYPAMQIYEDYLLHKSPAEVEDSLKEAGFEGNDLASALRAHEFSKKQYHDQRAGALYNVELKWPDAAREAADPLGEHHLLDWDAALSQQPEGVQRALMNLKSAHKMKPEMTGGEFYESTHLAPGEVFDPVIASKTLKDLGIPGIRYLDQASRGAGEGTRNYVIFDDAIPEIVTRNGEAVAKALRGAK